LPLPPGDAGAERGQFLVHLVGGFQLGDLLGDGLLAADVVGLDPAFQLVEVALDLLEAGQGLVDAFVVQALAHLHAVGRGLGAGDQRLLAVLGVGQLGLQAGDVVVGLGQRLLDLDHLLGQRVGLLGRPGLGHQRRLGEVLAVAGERDLGLAVPFVALARQVGDAALDLLLLGDDLDGRGAHLDQGVLHLLDDQADQLLRLLGAVEQRVEVGLDDVRQARKDAHDGRVPGVQPRMAPTRAPAMKNSQDSRGRLCR